MSSLLKEEMQRVLFRPEKHRLVEFIEIEEEKRGRHFLCVSESKSKEVQIAVVQCQKARHVGCKSHRIGLEDSYVKTEVWALQELRILDGRDPDVPADDPIPITVITKNTFHKNKNHRVKSLLDNLLKDIKFSTGFVGRPGRWHQTTYSCSATPRDDPCFLMHFDTVRPVKAVSCAAKYSLARCLLALSNTHQHTELCLQNFDWTYVQPTSIYSNRGDCMVLMRICFYAFNLVCLSLCPMP